MYSLTPVEQRLTAPVYETTAILAQYDGPSTTRRYALVPSVGVFAWRLGSTAEANGVDIIEPLSGAVGRWFLMPLAQPTATGVRVVAESPITLAGTQTIDGEALVAGDRVLVAGQASASANGFYIVSAGAWSRTVDFPNDGAMLPGTSVRVLEGSNPGALWYLSSPAVSPIRIGTSALVFSLDAGSDESDAAYSSVLNFSGTSYRTAFAGNGTGPCIVGLDEGPFVPGVSVTLVVPANTATALLYANNLDPNSDWDAFVTTKDYCIVGVAVSTTKVIATGKVIEAFDTTAPTIASAVVEQANLDRLILSFSEASQFPVSASFPAGDITGCSLGGTMAVARTISSVLSGNGTAEITMQLSGALDAGDAATFVVGASRQLRELDGTRIAAGSTAITINAGVYDYASMPSLTMFMDPALDNGSLADGAVCSTWTATAGTAATVWTAAGSERPTFRASKGGMPAMELDGVDDYFATTDTLGDLGNSTELWFAAAVWFDAIDTDAVPIYSNDAIIADAVGYWGVFAKSSGPTVSSYAFDGSIESASATVATGGWKIITSRVSGGNLYIGVNGVESAAEPLDAGITTMTDVMRIGRSAGGTRLDGWVGKMITLDGNPGGTVWADAVASLVTEYGAV